MAGQAAKEDASTAGDQAKWGSLHFFKHTPGDRLLWDHGVSELGVPHFMGLGEGVTPFPYSGVSGEFSVLVCLI